MRLQTTQSNQIIGSDFIKAKHLSYKRNLHCKLITRRIFLIELAPGVAFLVQLIDKLPSDLWQKERKKQSRRSVWCFENFCLTQVLNLQLKQGSQTCGPPKVLMWPVTLFLTGKINFSLLSNCVLNMTYFSTLRPAQHFLLQNAALKV